MERRSFLLGLFALSAGSTAAAFAGRAEAAALAPAEGTAAAAQGTLSKTEALTLPDGVPLEYAQYRRRRRRTVCGWRRNRWGRRVRVCRTIWY